MKSTVVKTTVREIRESLGRYLAILAIVALGVALFVGLKVTRPAMLRSGSAYLEENELYDLRFLSTLGFEDRDVKKLSEKDGVRIAEGSIYTDFLALDEAGTESVLRAHSILRVQNQAVITEGRMPSAPDECVVDSLAFGRDAIGTIIRVSENNDEDTRELFSCDEYTIVGLCDSPLYINYERGTTSLGNGKVKGFVYIPESGFDADYYTEIYVRLEETLPLYSDEYEDYIDRAKEWAEPFCQQLADERYDRLREEALWQIEDGERQLEERGEKAEQKLEDARKELEDAEKEIADGRQEIADGWQEIADARAEIAKNRGELNTSLGELRDGQAEIADGLEQLEEKRAEAAKLEGDERKTMEGGLNLKEAQVRGKQAQVEAGLAQADMGRKQLDSAENTLARQEEKLREAENELEEAEAELADGWEEYEEGRRKLEEELADAGEELADAREELAELEEPDTYVLGRDTNTGYVCYESDSSIVDGIANVFPVFFFLVAALVCITTMTRMVEEKRTQIGVFKALGYGVGTIMGEYLFYSGSAAIMGCLIGIALGSTLFPTVIWAAYRIMYRLGDLYLVMDWKLAAVSLAVSALCSMGTTVVTCRYEMLSVAASLMRPKAPKSGKRIFLEHIPFIWNRMKFLVKVSARNIFRYRQRFFMMVFGIGGCTALLLTGFGLKDSIMSITDDQYGNIQVYDMSVVFSVPLEEADRTDFEEVLDTYGGNSIFVFEESMDAENGNRRKSTTLVVPAEPESMDNYVRLHTAQQEPIDYPGQGEVVLTQKLAEKCGVQAGDTVTLKDEEMRTLTLRVAAVCENYVYNYAYISPRTWEEQIGESVPYKSVYLNAGEDQDLHQVSAALMNCEDVSSVTVNKDMQERFAGMMHSLDYVILLIIVCAGSLAFIVLYNLTNINITERIREIATIKVLGFTRPETASYVFRENLVLTGIGILVGLLMGKYFHRFVMSQIDIDMIAFHVQIRPRSVIFSVALTFVFAAVVNTVMNRKLDAINMAESMKSIE